MKNLFTYGTLMWPDIMTGVIGRRIEGRPAVLENARRLRVKGQDYPSLISANGTVSGVLYENLTSGDIAALDLFEGPEYDRRPVEVVVDGQKIEAETYFTSNAGLLLLEETEWTPDMLSPDRLNQFRNSYKGWS